MQLPQGFDGMRCPPFKCAKESWFAFVAKKASKQKSPLSARLPKPARSCDNARLMVGFFVLGACFVWFEKYLWRQQGSEGI
ncbi:MAG: hypothetical protein PHV02_05295 [Rhodocyclaceae bacterium]|nr:hypothetical protein [Rhodocyclaceae bacterium]